MVKKKRRRVRRVSVRNWRLVYKSPNIIDWKNRRGERLVVFRNIGSNKWTVQLLVPRKGTLPDALTIYKGNKQEAIRQAKKYLKLKQSKK